MGVNTTMKKDIIDELREIRDKKNGIEPIEEISTNKQSTIERLRHISDNNNFKDFINRYTNDPIGFIENTGALIDPEKGFIKPYLYPHQKEMLRAIMDDRFNIVHSPRQGGLTTTLAIAALHHLYFNDNQDIGIMDYKLSVTEQLLYRISVLYELLPDVFKQKNPITKCTRRVLELANGSTISALSTSPDVLHGRDIDFLLIDNFGMLRNPTQDEILTSLSHVMQRSNTTKVFIGSTAFGARSVGNIEENGFLKLWKDSYFKRNMFNAYSYNWEAVPGRGKDFELDMVSRIGEKAWKAEYETILTSEAIKDDQWPEQKTRD